MNKQLCSPFMSVQDTDPAYKLATHYSGTGPLGPNTVTGLSVRMERLSAPVDVVETITEAEDFYIAAAEDREVSFSEITVSPDADVEQGRTAALGILILRTANMIAKETRRGAGNVVMMSETNAKKFFEENPFLSTHANDQTTGETITAGRWTYYGTLNSSMSVWSCPDFLDTTIVVAYRGSSDHDAVTVKEVPEGYEVFAPITATDKPVRTITLVDTL